MEWYIGYNKGQIWSWLTILSERIEVAWPTVLNFVVEKKRSYGVFGPSAFKKSHLSYKRYEDLWFSENRISVWTNTKEIRLKYQIGRNENFIRQMPPLK